jgi:hypothetical protein
MQKEIVSAIAISFVLMAIGPALATDSFTFNEQINRPGNFVYTDNAAMSGWNQWSHSMSADAGNFASESAFNLIPVPNGAAPEEKSHENVQLNFVKYGLEIDPMMGETIDSDITVGAVGTSTIPTFDTQGNIPANTLDERYDLMQYTIGGNAGTYDKTKDTFTNDQTRGVNSQIFSSQDDYIHAIGYDSAGNENLVNGQPVMTSWDEATVMGGWKPADSSPYVQFNWQDTRSWKPVTGNLNGVWDINNLVQYKMYPIVWNQQFH